MERDHGVRVLFAVESGSRAWGFPSPDSDYDVRFVYLHPRDWYLSLVERRDVIEIPIDAEDHDISGWDLRKALQLLLRSNPPLYEWLVSPIVYREDGATMAALRRLAETGYAHKTMGWHYLRIADRTYRTHFGSRPEANLKKYFYVAGRSAPRWLRGARDVAADEPRRAARRHRVAHAFGAPSIGCSAEDADQRTREGQRRVRALDRWIEREFGQGEERCSDLPPRPRSSQRRRNISGEWSTPI